MSLDKIALLAGTDKASSDHFYTKWYERHVSKDIKLMMEIGIENGHSLKMWREWLPDTEIVAIDNNKLCSKFSDLASIYIGDQRDKDFLRSVASKHGLFDLIVDDGGHSMEMQISSMMALFNAVKPGGWYVIEDLATSYDLMYRDSEMTMIECLKNAIDKLNLNGKHVHMTHTGDKHKNIKELDSAGIKISDFERHLGEMHFYPGICFVGRI